MKTAYLITLICGILFSSCNAAMLEGFASALAGYSTYGLGTYYNNVYPTYNTTGSTGSTYSSSYTTTSSSSSSGSSSTPAVKTTSRCSVCSGTGTIVKYTSNYGSSEKKYCNICNKTVMLGHYHATCTTCRGKGYY